MSAHDPDIGAVPAGAAPGGGAAQGDTLPPEDLRERSLPDLVKQLTDQTTTLIKQEIELAKAELKETVDTAKAEMTDKAKEAGKGAGMLGAAGVIGLLAGIAFTAFLILVLALFLPDWLAALIVTVLYAAIAAVLALRGKKQLSKVGPPEKTIATVKDDVAWAKHPTRP